MCFPGKVCNASLNSAALSTVCYRESRGREGEFGHKCGSTLVANFAHVLPSASYSSAGARTLLCVFQACEVTGSLCINVTILLSPAGAFSRAFCFVVARCST